MGEVLLVVQIIIALAMIGVILLQRSAQDGGGLMGGGGTMGGLFTARGSANLLTRTTAILATLFILNSLALSYIASREHQSSNPLEGLTPTVNQTAPAKAEVPVDADKAATDKAVTDKPTTPQVPVSQ